MTRSVVAVVVSAAIILFIGIAVSELRLQQLFASGRADAQLDHEVALATEHILTLTQLLEGDERGFLLTGRLDFLQRYQQARQELERKLADLAQRFERRPERRAQVDAIRQALGTWESKAGQPEIAARERPAASQEMLGLLIEREEDAHLIDAARSAILQLRKDEERDRQELLGRVDDGRTAAKRTVAFSAALAGVIVLVLGLWLSLRLSRGVDRLIVASERIARGQYGAPVVDEARPLDALARSLRTTATALAERERQDEALMAVGRVVSEGSLEEVLAALRRVLAPLVPADSLWLTAVEDDRVRVLAMAPPRSDVPRDWPLASSRLAVAAKARRAVVVVDSRDDGYAQIAGMTAICSTCRRSRPGGSPSTSAPAMRGRWRRTRWRRCSRWRSRSRSRSSSAPTRRSGSSPTSCGCGRSCITSCRTPSSSRASAGG